mmetsp:Transcript_2477/g.3353  ORF Transcript_2477/g.3353 Transcript_2477/m.3353 type:complete len:263 (+) Transcript_2477:407-1195(+)|eukprot:CAMPEP_0204866800 /NCGR_PEP_ID=MMETSP1348-20121228/19192_1 /ASSEMBLY_ACC=CAM_ASM_000700 /TAXON_ID=215587 /ORGANISM="Aplanochytrium stocchinoi, Strain GSBS06" /LENGTH=262 /DNA_ID=CAMNT_0052018865 /DNA_START=225 /DNA_END=1013 /DNA_ORIENTATION=-
MKGVGSEVLVFGGSGFVGSHVLRLLSSLGYRGVSFSRTGLVPKHLQNAEWAVGANSTCKYLKADALKSFEYKQYMQDHLHQIESVVILTGSPPVPTFNQHDHEKQVESNGKVCETIINTAATCGINHVVLLNASMPEWVPKGYREGKLIARAAASKFAASSDDKGAVIIYPGGIYGTRHTASGFSIPLTLPMLPVSYALSLSQRLGVTNALETAIPYMFKNALCPMVSVKQVATAIVKAATEEQYAKTLSHISNDEILKIKV